MSIQLADKETENANVLADTKIRYTIQKPVVKASGFYLFIKRVFDILAAVLGFVILLVPILLIALAIKLDTGGTVIFRQERLGKDGKPFTMYKFRSMYMDAEKNGPQWAEKIDWRCTRVGRVLRKTRLDELPQLWNILIGDMSLVGPRPEREYFYKEFETYISGFHHRLVVRPGLTGLAQVNGGYDLKAEEKIVYDIEYIENMSVKMDIMCILKTARLVFTHDGAR